MPELPGVRHPTGAHAVPDVSRLPEVLDVAAIGSALVDVVTRVDEPVLSRHGLVKGSMALVDLARSEAIYAAMGPAIEMSGGSAANTVAGVAALGGTAGFIGKVAGDTLGEVFTHDIRSCGVAFTPSDPPRSEAVARETSGTGRCLILVTGDAERTMATHLGISTLLRPQDISLDLVERARILYLEGYLWDLPPAKEAMRKAVAATHDAGGTVALSLSDPFCVERHRREFLDLLLADVDVLFANEEEIVRLFASPGFSQAVSAAAETGLLMALTRGAQGSVVLTPGGSVAVPAAAVSSVVDTTGAGDLYAAGFLYGLAHGADPVSCARLGGVCAAEIISHLGARPLADLRALALAEGLL